MHDEPETVQFGEEKDKTDYLKEFPKLQMTSLNGMKEAQQTKILKQEYNRLYDRMLEMNDQLLQHENSIISLQMGRRSHDKEMDKIKTLIRNVVYMFPGGSGIKQIIDTSGWKTDDVDEGILSLVSDVIGKYKNMDLVIQRETKSATDENKRLKQEVVRLQGHLAKLDELERMILNGASEPAEPAEPVDQPKEPKPFVTPFIFPKETPAPEVPEISPPPFSFQPEEHPEEEADDLVLMNVDGYLDAMDEASSYLLEVIGSHGMSRNNELKTFLESDTKGSSLFTRGNKFNFTEMSQVVKKLRDTQLLNSVKVQIGTRGGEFVVFELSPLGKAVYKKKTGQKPAMSEMQQLKNQHATLQHGYLIKDSGALFKEMGYTVLMEHAETSVKLADGRRKDFDMVLVKDGKKKYIEVERGTHSKDDFFEAMDKIKEITNEFYFVCPNEKIMFGETKRLFFQWITQRLGGIANAKGLVANFTTFETLKDKKKQKNPWDTPPLG